MSDEHMFIERLQLVGYDRFALSQINNFDIKFTAKVQVILGTNGAGKSTLIAELSPLPADKKNYSKDGYKRIFIRFRKQLYTLTSSFNPDKHSIVVNDEELNPGGTITVQKELVKKIFGIDANTHALATGKHEFHSMSTATRKEWIRLLSKENFDYALQVYNRLKEAARDNQGALKLARNKLTSLKSKSLSESDLKLLIDETNELYKIVDFFIEHRNSPTAELKESERLKDTLLEEIHLNSELCFKLCYDIENIIQSGLIDNPKEINSVIYYVNNKLQELKEVKNKLFEDNKKHTETIETSKQTSMIVVSKVVAENEQYEKAIKKLKSSLIYNFDFPINHEKVLKTVENLRPRLLEITNDLQVNTNSTKYTRELYKSYVERKQLSLRNIDVLKANIVNYEERIDHHNKHKDSPEVTCPECNFSFKPFFNENIIKDLQEKIQGCLKIISEEEKQIEDLNVLIQDYDNWLTRINLVKDLANQPDNFNFFWSLIIKKEVLFENPKQISIIIENFKNEIVRLFDIQSKENLISNNIDKLKLIENTKSLDVNKAELAIKYISDQLEKISHEENRLNAIKDVANDLLSMVKKLETTKQIIINDQAQLDITIKTYVEDIRRVMYNEILRSFQSDLAQKEKIINDTKSHNAIVKSIEDEIMVLENNHEAFKLVLKELSPTEGLIAEGLFGYMKVFIKSINRFIATVWSYPLIVQPCKTEDDKLELNYKFPLLVNDKSTIRDDIAQGSSSMQEIIDLAFTVCALKSIGLGGASLFLDEFGSAMDPVHKHQTIKMIEDIVKGERFAQIFIISHDVAQYGSIDNTEVCILNSSNVIIPNGCIYNKHVTIS